MYVNTPKTYYIDLQLFKGGSTTVVNESGYKPTQYELELQKIQADLAKQYAPNATWLNDTAKNLLQNSLGAVQVDFGKLNEQAQNQINSANQSNQNLLGGIQNQINSANQTNQSLMEEAQSQNKQATQTNQNLMNGILPQEFTDNMTKAIQSGVQNSYGNLLSNSANNGVLNSSVTTTGMNDISKNVADTMAQQYQSNLNLLSGINNNNVQQQQNNLNLRGDLNNSNMQQYLSGTGLINNINNNNINNATAGITTAAGAQEAAQQPALNLWNASTGLAGSGNSTLNAIAGKGTTTTTQTTTGGGGLLGGLFGGLF